MLKVNHISKDYGFNKPIQDISFSLKRGEVLGLLGANGTGKSTTLNMISGFFPPSSGTISFDGFDLEKQALEYKKLLGYLPEFPPLYPDMTVKEQLGMICDVKGIPMRKQGSEIDRVCGLTGILDVKKRPIKAMSKGYKQRIGLAQSMIGDPGLLVLDEPVNGLDPQQIIDIRELIKDLGQEHAVIISSHILSEIASVSSRILVLNQGRIVADSPADELMNPSTGTATLSMRIEGERFQVEKLINRVEGVKNLSSSDSPETDCSDYIIEAQEGLDLRKSISTKLSQSGFTIMQMSMKNPTLEEIFIELTSSSVQSKDHS